MAYQAAAVDAVESCGFEFLGMLGLGHETRLFWHPGKRVELAVVQHSDSLLVKGMKKYFVTGQSKDGRETYVRDLPGLMRYMEDHFPEAHLYLGFFRDLSIRFVPGAPETEAAATRLTRASEELQTISANGAKHQKIITALKDVSEFGEASQVLRTRVKKSDQDSAALRSEMQSLRERLTGLHEMMAQYREHGRASALAFGYSSPVFCCEPQSLAATVDAVVDDVMNTHHTSVRQKLEGGQLQVFIEELSFPWMMYSAEAVGLYAPGQIERLAAEVPSIDLGEIEEALSSMLIVSPAEDIDVRGHRTPAKRIAAQAFREFLKRVDAVEPPSTGTRLPEEGVLIGHIMQGSRQTDTPLFLPLDSLVHGYCSGISGSGKSFLSRVIAEGAIADRRNLVALDPGNQWAGLLLPEDRSDVLTRFREFGMDPSSARGFPAHYCKPDSVTQEVSSRLEDPDGQPTVFSFKGLPKANMCDLAAKMLQHLFHTHARSESDGLRTLVIIEEAHRFTKLRSDDDTTKKAVAAVEDAIDLIAREGRKYGLNVFLVSQTIRDFTHSAATIRQNTTTKVFMRSSDRELDYAADYIRDPRQLTSLQPGEAIVCNPLFGSVKVRVRPPFSKVIELSARDSATLLGGAASPSSTTAASDEAEALLRVVEDHYRETGEPIIMSHAMIKIGVTSGRKKMALVNTLERQGLIRTQKLKKLGAPRVLFPVE